MPSNILPLLLIYSSLSYFFPILQRRLFEEYPFVAEEKELRTGNQNAVCCKVRS